MMLEACPVEAGHALVAVALTTIAHHDVIAAFAVHPVGEAFAKEDVVTEDRIRCEGVEVVAGGAVGHAELDPVVAFVAENELVGAHAKNKVVTGAAEGFRGILTRDDEILTVPA